MLQFLCAIFAILICVSESALDFTVVGYGANATGSANKNAVTVSTLSEFVNAVTSVGAATVYVNGTINGTRNGTEVFVTSDKSIIGIGNNSFLDGVGLHLKNVNNVIIRNLKFSLVNTDIKNQKVKINDGDCIRVEDNATNLWIDHNEFYAEDPAKQKDKDLYDGLIDVTHTADHITISWNYFHDHWKSNLIGSSDTDNHDRLITFHHNYWRNIYSRAPSYRFGSAHLYNNLFDHIGGSAVHTRMGACMFIEANVFENTKNPLEAHADSKVDGFFQVRDNLIDSTDKGLYTTSSNCTLDVGYQYTLEPVGSVKATVLQYAGVGKI